MSSDFDRMLDRMHREDMDEIRHREALAAAQGATGIVWDKENTTGDTSPELPKPGPWMSLPTLHLTYTPKGAAPDAPSAEEDEVDPVKLRLVAERLNLSTHEVKRRLAALKRARREQ